MSATQTVDSPSLPTLTDPIPNLLDKNGGVAAIKPIVIDFCSRLLTAPSTRRCYGDTALPQVIEHSVALFAAVLGKPVDGYDFAPMRASFEARQITQHAYEEIVLVMRHVLMAGGFGSRDACIAVNVLDIHSELVFGLKSQRVVTSPYAGVDRRRVARTAISPGTAGQTA